MDAELRKFEEELERMSPAGMPEGMIARMEAAMENWEDREESAEKVVDFPGWSAKGSGSGRKGNFWAAAAAVALLGAAAALFVPNGGKDGMETAGTSESPEVMAASFAPVNAHRNIINASDEGVVMTNDARPHRAVRLECVDRIEFRNATGERIRIEAPPRVRIVLIPVQTD